MDNVTSESLADLCAVATCPHRCYTLTAPLCREHLIDAWRLVEADPRLRPRKHVVDAVSEVQERRRAAAAKWKRATPA